MLDKTVGKWANRLHPKTQLVESSLDKRITLAKKAPASVAALKLVAIDDRARIGGQLLACQFAFPVRWIETQDELFSKPDAISRFIEIGPAAVLTGMARQTANLKHADRDLAKSVKRRFLSVNKDEGSVYYKYEPVTNDEPAGPVSQSPAPVAEQAPVPVAAPGPTVTTAPVTAVSDTPVQAHEIILSLIARKLARPLEQIPAGKSIKDITDGKSTLQNELIGILEAEFSSLPAAPEDLPISQLGEGIQQSFSGNLGKESARLISRMFSSKMPAGFGANETRKYLEQTWGLGTGRQTSLLLRLLAVEPASRLATVEAAKSFVDNVVPQYAATAQITLSKASAEGGQQGTAATMVDSKQIESLRKDHTNHLSKHFKLLADELQVDTTNSAKLETLDTIGQEFRSRLDSWILEFGDDFESRIQPAFDIKKVRRYDSSWNNVRLDIITLYHQMQMGEIALDESVLDTKLQHILNRADDFVRVMVQNLTQLASKTLHGARIGSHPSVQPSFQSTIASNEYESTQISPTLSSHASTQPSIQSSTFASTAPSTRASSPASMQEIAQGFEAFGQKILKSFEAAQRKGPVFRYTEKVLGPRTSVGSRGAIQYKEVSRQLDGANAYSRLLHRGIAGQNTDARQPYVHIRTRSKAQWTYDAEKTTLLLDSLETGATEGLSFAGKNILLTGAGPQSIGADLLQGLLMGGARVIVTTSRQPGDVKRFYQDLFAEHGARGSELIVLTFNQASKHDCASLIDHIYSDSGLNRDLDAIIPFAAISERGEIDELGSKSELAHRLMLTNVLRMLGHIADHKAHRRIDNCPTQVLLPLSPNHGIFGGDGLYAESKLGLESLLNKCQSESWSPYLSICGAVIGWTRGTDLMAENDIVAEAVESQGALTFSQKEMAFNLLALMSPAVAQANDLEPIWADLNGGLDRIADLKNVLAKTRANLNKTKSIRMAVAAEDALERKSMIGAEEANASAAPVHRSIHKVGYPRLLDYDREILPLQHLEGMVDLATVPVIVGFSELGPWGSSRTRWEIESKGKFSKEGYIEMAWMMNMIKHFSGAKDGQHYSGWVDSKTGATVADDQVGDLYGPQILAHAGVRLVEPELFGGYDPHKKEFSHEVAIEENLPEFEASRATAQAFKLRHGDKVAIRQIGESDSFRVQLKRGATVMVSKAVPFEGFVAGQIPTGWDAAKYGLPEDIVRQVDPVTAYALCCAAEALYSAGISDADELLQHVHISEIGNFVGSMMGGTTKTRNMYKDRYLDKDVQGDVMQETYLNTTAAWMNMLLLGTAGPIKTPTGACATGIESIDNACESLLSGKTKVCFVGGTDDFQEEESYAFRTMKATVNAKEELAKGRLPSEMSRPTSDTRAGFVEAQGSGVQIVTTAELALRMGLPIYGIIAASTMAGDKISRSVPAPGQGVLSFARETAEAAQSPLLDIEYRRLEMKAAIKQVQTWAKDRLQDLYLGPGRELSASVRDFGSTSVGDAPPKSEAQLAAMASAINSSAESQIKEIRKLWGNEFRRQNPDISPLRAALATWGLTINDLDFASLHGTSTKANDKNESDIINKQLAHLQRTPGKPVLAICQKSITGHPKAPAAAFMLNGCLQAINSGIVPGNRNADNVDSALMAFPHLTFPTQSIRAKTLKAFSMTSFGFGQKGGQVIGVHPRYLFGAIDRASYEAYAARFTVRTRACNHKYIAAMIDNRIIVPKPTTQYRQADQDTVLLDPYSRISTDASGQANQWYYDPEDLRGGQAESDSASPFSDAGDTSDERTLYSPIDMSRKNSGAGFTYSDEIQKTKSWMEEVVTRMDTGEAGSKGDVGVGIDIEEVLSSAQTDLQSIFVQRNFTAQERAIVASSPDPRSALTGRWSAKEAVFKSLGVKSNGAGATMRDIEIIKADEGMPIVKLHGNAYAAAQDRGITDFQISLSHSNNTAIAVALAIKGAGQPSY